MYRLVFQEGVSDHCLAPEKERAIGAPLNKNEWWMKRRGAQASAMQQLLQPNQKQFQQQSPQQQFQQLNQLMPPMQLQAPPPMPEMRFDADGSGPYTEAEFVSFYGSNGPVAWMNATHAPPVCAPAPASTYT